MVFLEVRHRERFDSIEIGGVGLKRLENLTEKLRVKVTQVENL